jgi:TolB-like protein/class 3 adenylate cyclase
VPAPPHAAQILPTGTVTFLFTDIEGSTRLWEAQPEAMPAALARHDELMRYAIGSRAGQVFKTVGDAFCAAFHTAPDALAAALEAQRAFHLERWPEALKLRVRMALHTGAVELRDNDYFGAPLSRVARLLAAGHGGQTLLSESTHDLCRDHLPPLAGVKALGEHGLKDLARREAVFQLCHPDLPSSFPALRSQSAPVDTQTPSIAVLPFVNMSRDEENEYFADGLSEELLNVLAKIRGLRVASRTSAFHFKGKGVDLQTIAQKLNVATVLEGSVRKAGNRVRITTQLIEVATDSHLWSETYDRELDDIFAVQDDIALSVVKELRAALLGERIDAAASARVESEVEIATKDRAENPEAYRLYLQGRFELERQTRAGIERSIELLRQALALDPAFARGWAGLSRSYNFLAGYGWIPVGEGFEMARHAAQRSLELAPDLVEGHLALGYVLTSYDRNWAAGDAKFRRALTLAPDNPDVLRALANHAAEMGRHDEAVELGRRAVALDPLSVLARRQYGRACAAAGRFDEAVGALRAAIDLNPQAGLTHATLSCTRLLQGRFDEALGEAEREVLPTYRFLAIAMAQHALGRANASDAALRSLVDKDADTAAYQIAQIHAYRGETDRAFDWLERAYAQRDSGLVNTATDPLLRSLHGDARWQPLVRKVGLA